MGGNIVLNIIRTALVGILCVLAFLSVRQYNAFERRILEVKGGIHWREAHLLMEMIADSGRMTSLEVTELNPILDVRNQSGQVAVELILSAFGKSIL